MSCFASQMNNQHAAVMAASAQNHFLIPFDFGPWRLNGNVAVNHLVIGMKCRHNYCAVWCRWLPGVLLVRNCVSHVLERSYFGGGTVDVSLATCDYHTHRRHLSHRSHVHTHRVDMYLSCVSHSSFCTTGLELISAECSVVCVDFLLFCRTS